MSTMISATAFATAFFWADEALTSLALSPKSAEMAVEAVVHWSMMTLRAAVTSALAERAVLGTTAWYQSCAWTWMRKRVDKGGGMVLVCGRDCWEKVGNITCQLSLDIGKDGNDPVNPVDSATIGSTAGSAASGTSLLDDIAVRLRPQLRLGGVGSWHGKH